ncbi:hypothetical protein FRB90_004864 [Tulasnella sp. 427]|nr:hypothetical protein FRB90_004864 [Tulasnella sp. 427]
MAPAKEKPIVQAVTAAASLKEAAEILRVRQRLPDIDSVQGLQQCYENFPKIWSQLKDLWIKKDEKLMGALCVIFGKMCKDAVLRSKLAEKGLIRMLTDALEYPNIHGVVLRALAVITAHSGGKERISVADRATDDIVRIASNVSSDDPVFTYCVTVLCHASFGRYSLNNDSTQRQKAQAGNAKPLLELMVRASKLPDDHVAGHAFSSLTMLTIDKERDILDSPEALRCLVGHLRHPELATRAEAFRALLTMRRGSPKESVVMDPQRVMMAQKRLKSDAEYNEQFMETGPYNMLLTTVLTSMMQNAQDRNMLSLGKKLYALLMRSEFGIGDGQFRDERKQLITDLGLPYTNWFEAIPPCVAALRAENPNSEAAVILEIKYEIKHRRFAKVHKLAKAWLEVNENCSYCYYALSMDQKNDKEGLKWSKLGLRTQPKGYIQLGLLFNCLDYAGRLGVDMLGDDHGYHDDPEKHMKTAIAYLHTALKDAKTYIDLAPVDDRILRQVLWRYLCLFVTFKGSALVDADLRKVQVYVDRLKLVERVSDIIWSPVIGTAPKLTWDVISNTYKSAAEEWDPIFSAQSQRHQVSESELHERAAEQEAPDGLEELVEKLVLSPDHHVNPDEASWRPHIFSRHLDEDMLELQRARELDARDGKTRRIGLAYSRPPSKANRDVSSATSVSYVGDAEVFQPIADLMTEESTVNSVWCNILSTYYFPFPEYIIKPEARLGPSGRHRADLLVTRSRDSKVVMIIEGKKAGGAQATWDKSVKQSQGYYNPVTKTGIGVTRVFCMAAVGRKVVFVAPNHRGADSVLWGIKVQRGKPMSFRGFKALDILEDSEEIHALLSHIKESVKNE